MKILALSAATVILSLSAGTVLAEEHKGRHDGPMTKAEFMAKAEKRFAKMDSNGDGSISREEHKAAREKMRDHRKDRKGDRKEKRDGDSPRGERSPESKRVIER